MNSPSEDHSSAWRKFLSDVAELIDDADGTSLSEPVLQKILETTTVEMRAVFEPMSFSPFDPSQNPHLVHDQTEGEKRPFVVKLAKNTSLFAETAHVAKRLNRIFFPADTDNAHEAIDMEAVSSIPCLLNSLAKLTHETLGAEGAPIVIASILQSDRQANDQSTVMDLRLSDVPEPNYPKVADAIIKCLGTWEGDGEHGAAKDIAGNRAYEKLHKKYDGDLPKMAARFIEILKRSRAVRRSILEAMQKCMMTGDRILVDTFIRQGSRTLAEHTKPVTDEAWTRITKGEILSQVSNPDTLDQTDTSPENREKLANFQREVNEALPQITEPNDLPALLKTIPAAEYRMQLARLKAQKDPGYEMLQKEIIHRVMRAVSRHHANGFTDHEKYPPSVMGLPTHVVEKKEANCFSGPWLISALLEECGIPRERIFYVNVQRTYEGIIGNHGSLIVTTEAADSKEYSEALLVDHGYSQASTLHLGFSENGKMIKAAHKLLSGILLEPVTLRYKDERATALKLHPHMQIMPLEAGLASGHLLHVGINFLREDAVDEAEYCFELGLSYNKQNPDLLYYTGIIKFKREELDEAEEYLQRALRAFPRHVQSHYSLGEIADAKGDTKKAKEYFMKVADCNPKKIYGPKAFHTRALHYLGLDEETLLKNEPVQKEQNTSS